MGTKLDPETSDFGKHYKNGIYTLGQILVYRAQRVWMYPDWLHSRTSSGKKQSELLDLLSSFRDSVINKRRKTANCDNLMPDLNCNGNDDLSMSGKKRLAMLDLLLQAEKEGVITAQGIGEEVDTFMFEVSLFVRPIEYVELYDVQKMSRSINLFFNFRVTIRHQQLYNSL